MIAALPFVVALLAHADTRGPDYIASDNVEYIKSFKAATGLTAGARIVGKYLYVTSSKDLEIFDISKPEDPQMVGSITANIQFENEEVPTNGKLLGISSDLAHSGPECLSAPPDGLPAVGGGCLRLYDVRDPANVKELPSVPGAGDHTQTCILDCTYLYGSDGTVVDATQALTPGGRARKLEASWKTAVEAQGVKFVKSCHNVRELRPGILITACQPFELLSVNAEDGGSILKPKVLATGANADNRFIHSIRAPREGADKFALVGGETNFKPQCGPTNGAFMTFDASQASATGKFTGPLAEIRPVNGSYLDSNPPAQILGCSVHWFEEHPTFRDGGLVALAEYENGTRFLQILPDGKIQEQGFFIPLGGSTSAPHWAPNSDILYAIDYERGIDVLRWKGQHYVPDSGPGGSTGTVTPEPGRVPGTEGRQPAPAAQGPTSRSPACASASGFGRVDAGAARVRGRRGGLRFVVSRRRANPFAVDVFQFSRGRRIIPTKLVARFRGRTGSFTWSGTGLGPRRLADGDYLARFVMGLRSPNRFRDVRFITLRRSHGRFTKRPAYYADANCSTLRLFGLQRPVFGGAGKQRSLGISYRLSTGVDSVSIVAVRGARVIKRFSTPGRSPAITYRALLSPRGIPSGSDVQIRLVIKRAGATQTSTLVARRL